MSELRREGVSTTPKGLPKVFLDKKGVSSCTERASGKKGINDTGGINNAGVYVHTCNYIFLNDFFGYLKSIDKNLMMYLY